VSVDFGRQVLRQESRAILVCADALDEAFETAVQTVLQCRGRIVTCGVGKSGHIARKTAGTLSSTGTPSLFLHAAEAVHGDLGMVTKEDVVLLYTHSGETDELVRLFPSIRSIGAKTILITGRPNSSAGRQADLVLNTLVEDEACPNNLAPTTSTTVMLALSDALAVAVMKRRGFTKEDFARFHPSGTLGKRLLLRVSDIMRPRNEIAVAESDTEVLEVMREITQAGVGAACVVAGEAFMGIITEGDLRRAIVASENRLHGTAGEIMTQTAWTITSDLLAVEALEVFQNLPHPIGEMPVIDHGKLVGLLMLKDLLRSGIV
jgi:arabinose-5-phosphate isomerase